MDVFITADGRVIEGWPSYAPAIVVPEGGQPAVYLDIACSYAEAEKKAKAQGYKPLRTFYATDEIKCLIGGNLYSYTAYIRVETEAK